MAAMTPEKSRSLHNFSLPPRLSWGAQRVLRCSKVNSSASQAATATASVDGDDHHHRRPRLQHDGSPSSSRSRRDPADPDRKRESLQNSPDHRNASAVEIGRSFGVSNGGGEDQGIEVMREKLMIDLQTEVDKIKNAILAEGVEGEADRPPPPNAPWNLRTRRAACMRGDDTRLSFSPPPAVKCHFNGENVGGVSGEKRERAKFSVSLCREEIEEDFMELTRRRPARKPKKRPRYVQKQLDTLFPGLWLSEITADMYKVIEHPESVKGQ